MKRTSLWTTVAAAAALVSWSVTGSESRPVATAASPAAAPAAAPAPAPAADPAAAPALLAIAVGNVEGHDSARIGIAVEGKDILAYVCSQDAAFNESYARWFKGKAEADGSFTIAPPNPKDPARLKGSLGETIKGSMLAADGKVLAYSAAAVDDGVSGLYRAEDEVDGDKYVLGWVVDPELNVAGAVQNNTKGKVTLPTPPAGATGRIVSQQGPKAQPVAGQKVVSPNIRAVGRRKGEKVTDQKKAASDAAAVNALAAKGGSPLFAAFLQQTRRFLSGARPANDTEAKVFARLARANRKVLADYVAAWDKEPAAKRGAVLGGAAALRNDQPLTPVALRSVSRRPVFAAVKAAASAPPPAPITRIRVTRLVCVNECNPEKILGVNISDEVFVIFTVVPTQTDVDPFSKTTQVYEQLDSGVSVALAPADMDLWPKAGTQATVTGDVEILADFIEDDTNDIATAKALLGTLVDVAATLAPIILDINTPPAGNTKKDEKKEEKTEEGKKPVDPGTKADAKKDEKKDAPKLNKDQIKAIADAVKTAIDGALTALPKTDRIGTAVVVVAPDRKIFKDDRTTRTTKLAVTNANLGAVYETSDILLLP